MPSLKKYEDLFQKNGVKFIKVIKTLKKCFGFGFCELFLEELYEEPSFLSFCSSLQRNYIRSIASLIYFLHADIQMWLVPLGTL